MAKSFDSGTYCGSYNTAKSSKITCRVMKVFWNFALQMALNPNGNENTNGIGNDNDNNNENNYNSQHGHSNMGTQHGHGLRTDSVCNLGRNALFEQRLRLIYVNDLPHFALHNKWHKRTDERARTCTWHIEVETLPGN